MYLSILLIVSLLYPANPKVHNTNLENNSRLTNPMLDRAKGYALMGKAKSAVSNYGNYADWDLHPAGLWGDYTYLPSLSFLAGVPGQKYSSEFTWEDCSGISDVSVWCSNDAYVEWLEDTYVGIVFDSADDRGIVGSQVDSISEVDDQFQWGINSDENYIFISVIDYDDININPNYSNARIGFIYPWALRPALSERLEEFDLYDYGDDQEGWTADDNYVYYGANVAESWFYAFANHYNSDWQPTLDARLNSHQLDVTSGDVFGDTPFTHANDTGPLLAHSNFSNTWPELYDFENNQPVAFWPGFYAMDYYGDDPTIWASLGITNCNGTYSDNDCWIESEHRFFSDSDIYMEFDDRWAHRGNQVMNNEYRQTGYPMGIKVRSQSLSYGTAFAEDIMFFITKIRNESGMWVDEEGNYHLGMVMPDDFILNSGNGFNYKKMSLGFYMYADVLTGTIDGSFSVHSNADDMMEYYWESFAYLDQNLMVSMALIYDYEGISNGVTDLGFVGIQLLDTPLADEPIDLDQNGIVDIFPGEPLKMTDWHWFDWYNRPGVVDQESNSNCCAGYSDTRPQALNKEEIMYKLMSGDTTNLSVDEKQWFFHTPYPDTDLGTNLNPHFDSLEGIELEPAFIMGADGLDCVLQMSAGPFDLDVGEEVNFSFALIFGENKEDLIQNAKYAQILYHNKYSLNPNHQLGDITADGIVNISDILSLIQIILGNTEANQISYIYGDINNDGILDILDIILIIHIIID